MSDRAMKNVTVTMAEGVLQKARVAAAREGMSLSRFVSETIERRVGRPMTRAEALERYLSGPLLPLTDENGKAPSRDALYD